MFLWIDTVFRFVAFRAGEKTQIIRLPQSKNGGALAELLPDLLSPPVYSNVSFNVSPDPARDTNNTQPVCLGVNLGPGSFTGIKNGIATALALARYLQSCHRLVAFGGLRSLDLLASATSSRGQVILDARRQRFYTATCSDSSVQGNIEDLLPEEFSAEPLPRLAWDEDALAAEHAQSTVSSEQLARLALSLLPAQKLLTPEPCYVRPPDAKAQNNWRNRLLGWD